MIILRIRGAADSLRFRLCEWLLAAIMLSWGWILLLPSETFDTPSMVGFARIAPEIAWGLACFGIGALRLAVLAINGMWRRVHNARALAAGLSALVWFTVFVGVLKGGFVTPSIAIYPLYIMAELYTVWRAAADARILDDAATMERAADGIP